MMRKQIVLRGGLFAVEGLCLASMLVAQSQRPAGKLSLHQPVERELASGQTDLFTVEAGAGQFVSLVARKKGLDVTLAIADPNGKALVAAGGPRSTIGSVTASWIAETPGAYSIVVAKSAQSPEIGKYEIECIGLRQPTDADRAQIQAEARFQAAWTKDRAGDRDSRLAAIPLYEEAASLWRGLNDGYHEAISLYGIGVLLNALGQAQKALEIHQRTLPMWRAIGDRAGEAGALNSIGVVYNNLGDNQKALDSLQQALTIRRAIGDRSGESITLHNMGVVYFDLSQQQKALDSYQQSIDIKHAIGDRAGEANTLVSVGVIYTRTGDQQKALEYFERALPIRRSFQDRSGEAVTLHDIGLVYSNLSELPKALDYYRQALAIRRAIGDRRGEGSTLGNIGLVYQSLGETQKALDYFQQALALDRSTGDRKREAGILSNIGGIYYDLGEKQRALEYYQQALPIERAVGDRLFEAETLSSIGDIYFGLGEKQKGLDYFQQTLSISRAIEYRSGEVLALNNLGAGYSELKDHRQALGYFEQAAGIARAIGDRSREAYCLLGIGMEYFGLKDNQKARDSLTQALNIRTAIRERPGEAEALHQLAVVESEVGNLDQARTLAANARNIVESLRSQVVNQALRSSYFSSVQDYYSTEMDVLMRLDGADPSRNYRAAAFEISERARARVLLETLGEAHTDIREGVDPALQDRERTLQAQLNAKELARVEALSAKHTPEEAAAAEKAVSDLTAQYEDVRTEIRVHSPRYAALVFPQPLNLNDIQKEVLDPDTVLLEYALGDQRSFVWIVSPTSIAGVVLPKRAEVEQAAQAFYDGVTKAGGASGDAGKVLSRMLFGDAAPLVAGKRLLIVADGALQYLPFPALPDPDGSGEPLVAHHEIVTAPSASTLAILRRENLDRKPAPKVLAVLADPVFSANDSRLTRAREEPPAATTRDAEEPLERSLNDVGLAGPRLFRLPGTRREAAGILSLVPEADRKQALDFDASRTTLMSPEIAEYRMLHLATHGLLNGVHPELSGLVFSMVDRRGTPQDGFLRLNEIYNLKLGADLVVLSACQTGLGKDTRGEGLVGLTRGFMYAGAPRVMASLWKVDDRATAELMKKFYTAMLGQEALRPAAALRAAQVEMWKTKGFEDPYYWAAFTLQGEWR